MFARFVYAHKQYNVLGSKHATMKTLPSSTKRRSRQERLDYLAVAAEQRGLRTAVFSTPGLCYQLG
jgi:hypothetical protein